MTTQTPPGTRSEPARRPSLRKVGTFVDERVRRLQNDLLSGHPTRRAGAVADLARLRRGVAKPVGSLPELWRLTLDGAPLGTTNEAAAYTAITLYAVHQQSRPDRMHRPGHGLGRAVRLLEERQPRAERERMAPPHRFHALATASSFTGVVHHARALITQLRGEGIGLDYGQFADQLVDLQRPDTAARVRLAWGRDFYRSPIEPAARPAALETAPGDASGTESVTSTEGAE